MKDGIVWMALNAGTKQFPGTEERFAKIVEKVVAAVEVRGSVQIGKSWV